MKNLVGALLSMMCIAACGSSYDSMPAAEVAKLSDADLCLMRFKTAVGFVPMEVTRRGLTCSNRRAEMIERLIAEVPYDPYQLRADQIIELFPQRCDGLSASVVATPSIVSREYAGGVLRYNNPNRYTVRFENRTARTQYYLITLRHLGGKSSEYRIGKLVPRGRSELPIAREFESPTWPGDASCFAV